MIKNNVEALIPELNKKLNLTLNSSDANFEGFYFIKDTGY
jgi:hypothetical protein